MKKLLFGLVVLFLISLACNLPVPQSIPSNEPGIVISSGSQQTQETKEIEAISTSSGASPTGVSSQVETWLDCPGEISNLITGIDVLQTPASEDPTARQPFRDPVFGTCLVRVTERQKDPFSEDETQGLKNEYSRVRAFNSNGSFFLIHGLTGSTYLYDSSTLLPISLLPVDIETRWDAVDPHLLCYISIPGLSLRH